MGLPAKTTIRDEEAAEERARATYVRAPDELLHEMAVAASSTAELPVLIERFAMLALEAANADRVSFFLANADRTVVTLWSTTSGPNPGLWELGKSMAPIRLDRLPDLWSPLDRGEVVFVADARTSPLIPAEWTVAFQLTSLIIAPLHRADSTVGFLVADYRQHTTPDPEILNLLATIGRLCAVAMENSELSAELRARAASLDALVGAASSLGMRRSLTETSEEVADAIARVLGSDHLSVHLFDPVTKLQRLLAQRGFDLPVEGDAVRLARGAFARVARAWLPPRKPKPVVLDRLERMLSVPMPDGIRTLLVLPLARPDGDLFGFILVGRREHVAPSAARLEVATALASHVGFAIHRAQLDERVAIGSEFARALLAIHDIDPAADTLLTSLDRAIPSTIGFRLESVQLAVPSDTGRRNFTAGDEVESGLWRAWRPRRSRPDIHETAGFAYAAVWSGGRSFGILKVRAVRGRLERHERDLLEALASAIGEWIARRAMRRAVERGERELALADERGGVAADLHANIGRLLDLLDVGIQKLADEAKEQHVVERAGELRDLLGLGRASLALTVRSLGAFEYHPDGLPPTLAEVAKRLAEQLDVAADVVVRGEVRPLPLEVEQALLRVAHEILSRVEVRGRASAVAVRLEYGDREVRLIIHDDGVGLAARETAAPGPNLHTGLRTIRQRLEALGGSFELERPEPRGLVLICCVPF